MQYFHKAGHTSLLLDTLWVSACLQVVQPLCRWKLQSDMSPFSETNCKVAESRACKCETVYPVATGGPLYLKSQVYRLLVFFANVSKLEAHQVRHQRTEVGEQRETL